MIFVDTGALLARYLPDDKYYSSAQELWKRLEKKGERLCTSNFVIDETLTLLGRRTGNSFASRHVCLIYESEIWFILRPEKDDEVEALVLFEKFADQKVSFTDCISFVLMRKKGITEVFSFDRHFQMAGFSLLS